MVSNVVLLCGLYAALIGAPSLAADLSQTHRAELQSKFQQALRFQQTGNRSNAIAMYEQLTREHPDLVVPFINLAAVHASAGNFEQARKVLEAGLNVDEHSKQLFSGLQRVYGAEAAQAYHEALGSKSPSPRTLRLSTLESLDLPSLAVAPQPLDNSLELARIAQLEQENRTLNQRLLALQNNTAAEESEAMANLRTQLREAQTALSESQQSLNQSERAREALALDLQLAQRTIQTNNQAALASAATVQNQPAAAPEPKPSAESILIERVKSWAKAWGDQDVQAYLAHYDNTYTTYGLTRQEWLAQRRIRLTQRSFINVDVSNFRVADRGDQFAVTFEQRYRSDSFDDTIRKRLVFAKNETNLGLSKIVSEEIVSQ